MDSNKERELERIRRVWEASEEVPVAESCDLSCVASLWGKGWAVEGS